MEVSGQLNAPATLPPGKEPLVPPGEDTVMKRKIPSPHRESNPRTPIVQLVASRYTDWAMTILKLKWDNIKMGFMKIVLNVARDRDA
jgi:hypothetical protein